MRTWIPLMCAVILQPDTAAAFAFPVPAQSQSGAIAGTVKGPTGAGVAGATVEAASPALTEKTRTVVTDFDGSYRIVGLRTGIYVVTFTMPTFNPVRVEGVEVTSSFTATVNAALQDESDAERIAVSPENRELDVRNVSEDLDPTALFYTPDPSKPAVRPVSHASADARLTVQVTPRNKIDAYYHAQYSDFGTCLAPNRLTAPSACAHSMNDPQWFGQASWTSPLTTRVVLEAGATITVQKSRGGRDPGVRSDLSSITESATGFTWRAPAGGFGGTRNNQSNYRAAVSYVTGRHAVKAGVTFMQQWRRTGSDHNNSVNYIFNNGVPSALTQFAEPARFSERVNDNLGVYAQDQWTLNRLTLNLGVRTDFLNAQVNEQHLPAGPLIGPRSFRRSRTYRTGATFRRVWVPRTISPAMAGPCSRQRSLDMSEESRTRLRAR